MNVFHLREAHGLAGFGGVGTHAGDETRHADFFFVMAFAELTGKIADDLGERGLIFVERMVGDIQPDQFALPVEHLALIHVFDFGQVNFFDDAGGCAEETHLSGIGGSEMIAGNGNDAVERGQE